MEPVVYADIRKNWRGTGDQIKEKKKVNKNPVKYETSLSAALGKGGDISTGTQVVQFLSLSLYFSLFKILSSESMMILYDKVMSPCALL